MAADREELLLLRVQDPNLAERLHAVLSERPDAPKDPIVELRFDGTSSVICCITETICPLKRTCLGAELDKQHSHARICMCCRGW